MRHDVGLDLFHVDVADTPPLHRPCVGDAARSYDSIHSDPTRPLFGEGVGLACRCKASAF
eukprot:6444491-Pyramimonas_sp.AAC.1